MNTVQPIRDMNKIAEMKKLLKAKSEKYYIMFAIGLNTGLRISDILQLKASDMEDKTHATITERKTKKVKRFLINKLLSKDIKSYIFEKGLTGDDYLIPSREGVNRPLTRIQAYRVLNECAAVLGLSEIGTHTMRKTFGYWHYKNYKDVAVLQEIFNHSAPGTTLRYIGINDDNKDKTLKNFFL